MPGRKKGRPQGAKTKVGRTDKGEAQATISAKVSKFFPLFLNKVENKEQRDLWFVSFQISVFTILDLVMIP